MRHGYLAGFFGVAACLAAPAQAGEVPLYQPAPAWIVPAPLPDSAALGPAAPPLAILDVQQRVEDGRLWSYRDTAMRIDSPEMLAQFATLSLPWTPDKGDLIVHELSVLRGGERVDLLAQGQKFTVLRREEALEQHQMTGVLTATLAAEGLRVGDLLRLRTSTTAKDAALGGHVQNIGVLIAAPVRVGMARMRLSWPTDAAPRYKIMAEGVSAKPERKGAYTELVLDLPAPKQPEMPEDAPSRYRHPPIVALSTFSGWAEVSKVMAPLYATDGTIAPGSPIASEVAAIMRAEATPLGRAQRALELVQDKVRYLAVGMDGGNYVPQAPSRTWEVRYGDCKAKTLLLIAMLRAMDIEAEPVLAHSQVGDFVPDNLPSAAAFDHVLVRATIGGETLWMDGTASGSRLADIRDTPPFGWVLPARASGAELVQIPKRSHARPTIDLTMNADESASTDLPSVFDVKMVLRGQPAAMMTLAAAQMGEEEKREMIGRFLQDFLGEAQFGSAAIVPDTADGSATITARAVVTTPWTEEERRRVRYLSSVLASIEFSPDRGRAAWKAIPVATAGPLAMRFTLRVRLPEGGRGYTVEGERDLQVRLAGHDVTRKMTVADGVVTLEERMDSSGVEIAAADIARERDKVAIEQARAPRVVAPKDALRRWDLAGADPAGATQLEAVEETLARAIAVATDDVTGYQTRASVRNGIGNRRGALEDLGRAIALRPSTVLHMQRAWTAFELGDLSSAMADAEAARELDPSSPDATGLVAQLKAEQDDLAGAVALLDERIAYGGDMKADYLRAKANLVGEYGDPAEAVALFDTLVAEKPGSPTLLNGRCWVKGSRAVMLDTALKDCTEAIELSTNAAQALDSRAMVWYRLGKNEEAMRDLDAALAAAPAMAQSRFLRSIVLARLGRDAEAAKDLRVARRLKPTIEKENARYGIAP